MKDLEFPVIPEDDIDLWMGVWTEGEVSFILRFIHTLLTQDQPFFTGNDDAGLASGMTDKEWNDWVHQMLDQLLQIERLGFERPMS